MMMDKKDLSETINTGNVSFGVKTMVDNMRYRLVALCILNHKEHVLNNPNRINHLVNLASIVYMRKWLAADCTAYQNLHAFCREKYLPQGQQSRLAEQKPPYSDDYNAMYKATKRLAFDESMIIRQAEAEGVFNNRNYIKNQSSSYDKPLHFFQLWKLDKERQGRLFIQKLLLERKKFLGTTSKTDGNNTLCEAYNQYYRIFWELSKGISSEGKLMSDEEYVTTALMSHELEVSQHFHLSLLVAIYMKACHIPINQLQDGLYNLEIAERVKNLWSRFKGSTHFMNSHGPTDKPFEMEYRPYSILNYPQSIPYLFSGKQEYNEFLAEYLLDMILVETMAFIEKAEHPLTEIPSWTSQDYQVARTFFETRYPVHAIINQVPIDEKGNLELGEINNSSKDTIYDYIRAFQFLMIHMGDKEKYNPDAPTREDYQNAAFEFRKKQRHTIKTL